MRALALAAVLLAGCSSQPASQPSDRIASPPKSVQGTYPAPRTTYQGHTAAEWGPLARDKDRSTRSKACEALQALGAEGVPYLLAAIKVHESDPAALSGCLAYLDGKFLAPSDLRSLLKYLEDERIYWIIPSAQGAISKAGEKARVVEPEIRALTRHRSEKTRAAAQAILKAMGS